MKAGGGGGDGAVFFGEGGLVASVVEFLRVAFHVVGESESSEFGVGHLVPVDEAIAVVVDFGDGASGFTNLNGASGLHLFAGANHGAPAGVGDFFHP